MKTVIVGIQKEATNVTHEQVLKVYQDDKFLCVRHGEEGEKGGQKFMYPIENIFRVEIINE